MTTQAQQHAACAARLKQTLTDVVAALPRADAHCFADRLVRMILRGVITDLECALAGTCPEDPVRLLGAPLGQYHCPDCGCMTVAGLAHVHGDGCLLGLDDSDLTSGPQDVQ